MPLTLRYLVRSYVTNPTTIRAITEIPAKTPRPIGRTESFFPGSVNAAVEVEACSAAASDATDAADEEDDAAAATAAEDKGLLFATAEVVVGVDVTITGGGVTDVVAEVDVAGSAEGAGAMERSCSNHFSS